MYEILEIDRALADAVRRGDLEGFARAARRSEGYVPLAQGAIDLALGGVTSLAEAMAVGSGLEEFVDVDADDAARGHDASRRCSSSARKPCPISAIGAARGAAN